MLSMSRTSGILMGVVGVLLGVLGTIGVQQLRGTDEPTMLEDIPGYSKAHDGAKIYCTLGGVVPGMTSLHDPEYLQCVEDWTRQQLQQDGHPEAETAESRLD